MCENRLLIVIYGLIMSYKTENNAHYVVNSLCAQSTAILMFSSRIPSQRNKHQNDRLVCTLTVRPYIEYITLYISVLC